MSFRLFGFDVTIQAMAGVMSVTGERDDLGGGPQKVGVAVADLFTGMYSTVAILAALRHAEHAAALPNLSAVWKAVYQKPAATLSPPDVDENLYGGFVSPADRRTLAHLRTLSPADLAAAHPTFDDAQLTRLLHRYRARNFPETLRPEEASRWRAWCRQSTPPLHWDPRSGHKQKGHCSRASLGYWGRHEPAPNLNTSEPAKTPTTTYLYTPLCLLTSSRLSNENSNCMSPSVPQKFAPPSPQ